MQGVLILKTVAILWFINPASFAAFEPALLSARPLLLEILENSEDGRMSLEFF